MSFVHRDHDHACTSSSIHPRNFMSFAAVWRVWLASMRMLLSAQWPRWHSSITAVTVWGFLKGQATEFYEQTPVYRAFINFRLWFGNWAKKILKKNLHVWCIQWHCLLWRTSDNFQITSCIWVSWGIFMHSCHFRGLSLIKLGQKELFAHSDLFSSFLSAKMMLACSLALNIDPKTNRKKKKWFYQINEK